MGACASKFTVLNSADGAPTEPVETRDVKLVEETVKGDAAAAAPAPAEEEEAKRQSLGEWFKENEGAEVLAKKSSSNLAPVADAPAKDEAGKAPVNDDLESKTSEEKKTEDIKSSRQNVVEADASLNKTGEKPGTEKKPEENKPDEKSSTEKKSEENKQDSISGVEKKPDAPETGVTEEQKAALYKKTIAAKPAETTKLEISGKIEDKPDLEAVQTEKPGDESSTDKKPATPELKHEVQKSGLDAEHEKEERKPEVTTNIVVSEKEPETLDIKRPDEQSSVLDAEKEKTDAPTETSKPVAVDTMEREETKSGEDVEKQKTEEKPTPTEVSAKVVVEPQPTEKPAESRPDEKSPSNKNPEKVETRTEEKKPASDA